MATVTKRKCFLVCLTAQGHFISFFFISRSVYFYTPDIMESVMARELFMDIGREIMSVEDGIKCYDNGDNTQHSAPGSWGNILSLILC